MNLTTGGPRLITTIFLVCLIQGCAIHYFNPKTGTEHIYGIGHMKLKVTTANEGLKAVYRETNILGMGIGIIDGQKNFTIGWDQRRRLDVIEENIAVRLEWPDSRFFNIRVGKYWPHEYDEQYKKEKNK